MSNLSPTVVACMKKAGWKDEQIELWGENVTDTKVAAMIEEELINSTIRKRNIKLQAIQNYKTYEYLIGYKREGFSDAENLKAALDSMIVRDHHDIGGSVSMEARQTAIVQTVHAEIIDLMDAYKPSKLGFASDPTGLENMARELHRPGSTNDVDARAYAEMWTKAMENLRLRFNKAGGSIAKLETWYLPQRHDTLKVGKAKKDDWVQFTFGLLDRQKMVDHRTGQVLDDPQLKEALAYVYDTISTEGTVRIQAGKLSKNASSSISNKHKEHRFLHFSDGDAWLQYQKEFGSYNIYASMTDHIDLMAKEISAMETFGPAADSGLKFAQDIVLQRTGTKKSINASQNHYDNVLGRNYTHTFLGEVGSTLRHHAVTTKLGSALISAMSDTVFLGMTSSFNGIPALKVYSRFISILNPLVASDRKIAARLGLGAEYAIDGAVGANRHVEATGYHLMARMSAFTMKASGLHGWTIAGKQAFGMEFLAHMSDMSRKSFDELDGRFKEALDRYGISKDDWEIIRTSPKYTHKGVDMVDVASLGSADLQTRVVGMIASERKLAVPEPDARVKSIMYQDTKSGTAVGEVARGIMTFKSFPITMLTTHLARARNEYAKGGISRLNYTATLLIGTTILGGIAYQAKEIAKGKDPMEWNDPEFLLAAFLQGGGLGIFGDFIFKDQSRYGNSFQATVAGPQAAMIEDVLFKLLLGNAHKAYRGEDTNFMGDLLKTGYYNIPGKELWYTKLALERAVYDQLRHMVDPKAAQKDTRLMRNLQREQNRGYYWKPSAKLKAPERAPDLQTDTMKPPSSKGNKTNTTLGF